MVPQAREVLYNAMGISDLIKDTGLKPEPGYEPPYAAVVAPVGPLNSGAVIRDPKGDIVGADVENDIPEETESGNSTTRNSDPEQQTEQSQNEPALT